MSEPFELQKLPTGFELDSKKTAGNAHSGHNVVFGVLGEEEVAVKPFVGADGRTLESRRNKALHEKRMYETVKGMGFLTLDPIEVAEEHGIAYLVTSYTPNLITGTSFDLTRPLGDTSRGKSGAEVVSEIMSVTGELHEHEVTHGDAKLRNFAFHRVTGDGVYVVDLEGAQKHNSHSTGGSEYYENAVKNDLRSIAYNLGQNGLATSLDEATQMDVFDDLIIAPYASSLSDTSRLRCSVVDATLLSFNNGILKYLQTDL
jgi:hypothetical protein